MRKRVLILTGESPDRPGGVEHFVRELMKRLEEHGYSTEVFHCRNSVPSWLTSRTGKIGRHIAASSLGYFVGRRARKRMGPDVAAVISNGDVGYCAPKPIGPGAKRIHMYHGTYRGQAEAIRSFISRRGYLYMKWWSSGVLERLGGRRRIVICNSEQTKEEVSRFFGHNGTVVWLPLQFGNFRLQDPLECRRRLGLSNDTAWGLFVGSTDPTKGFGTVRQLMDALPGVQWILVIRGRVPPDLAALSRVRVFCDLPEQDLPSIYAAADFLICPSYYESFGYVVAEALACGTPVVASTGGASRAFLCDAPLDHLLIPDPRAIDQFAGAVHAILLDRQVYRRAVEEHVGPKLVEMLAPENWWQRFSEVTGL